MEITKFVTLTDDGAVIVPRGIEQVLLSQRLVKAANRVSRHSSAITPQARLFAEVEKRDPDQKRPKKDDLWQKID